MFFPFIVVFMMLRDLAQGYCSDCVQLHAWNWTLVF